MLPRAWLVNFLEDSLSRIYVDIQEVVEKSKAEIGKCSRGVQKDEQLSLIRVADSVSLLDVESENKVEETI